MLDDHVIWIQNPLKEVFHFMDHLVNLQTDLKSDVGSDSEKSKFSKRFIEKENISKLNNNSFYYPLSVRIQSFLHPNII